MGYLFVRGLFQLLIETVEQHIQASMEILRVGQYLLLTSGGGFTVCTIISNSWCLAGSIKFIAVYYFESFQDLEVCWSVSLFTYMSRSQFLKQGFSLFAITLLLVRLEPDRISTQNW